MSRWISIAIANLCSLVGDRALVLGRQSICDMLLVFDLSIERANEPAYVYTCDHISIHITQIILMCYTIGDKLAINFVRTHKINIEWNKKPCMVTRARGLSPVFIDCHYVSITLHYFSLISLFLFLIFPPRTRVIIIWQHKSTAHLVKIGLLYSSSNGKFRSDKQNTQPNKHDGDVDT